MFVFQGQPRPKAKGPRSSQSSPNRNTRPCGTRALDTFSSYSSKRCGSIRKHCRTQVFSSLPPPREASAVRCGARGQAPSRRRSPASATAVSSLPPGSTSLRPEPQQCNRCHGTATGSSCCLTRSGGPTPHVPSAGAVPPDGHFQPVAWPGHRRVGDGDEDAVGHGACVLFSVSRMVFGGRSSPTSASRLHARLPYDAYLHTFTYVFRKARWIFAFQTRRIEFANLALVFRPRVQAFRAQEHRGLVPAAVTATSNLEVTIWPLCSITQRWSQRPFTSSRLAVFVLRMFPS